MSYNGSGTFLINSIGQPVVSGTVISSSTFNSLTADLATGLSTAITKDGQTTITNNIPFNSYKITNLGAGTAATDAARLGQVQGGTATLVTVSGTDTYTGTMSPALASYAAGNLFSFVVPNTNTSGCTLNIDGLGAKALTRDGSTALVAGDLVAGNEVLVAYDGTRFQVLNSNSVTNQTVSGNLTLSGGTANGVLYLNGSKVATSGAALTFDGSRLVSTTGKFGSGAAANSATLMVNNVTNTATGVQLFQDGIESWIMGMPANSSGLTWSASGSEQMRLTNLGNLGIGTTPSYKLDVNATGTESGRFLTTGAINALYLADSGTTAGSLYIGTVGNDFRIVTGTNERLRLNSAGNLGLGVTPSAWNVIRAIQVGAGYGGAFYADPGSTITGISSNTYYGVSGWTYFATATAAKYEQGNGDHSWFTAASGTAGNAVSFTKSMLLDSAGDLVIGDTSTNGIRLSAVAINPTRGILAHVYNIGASGLTGAQIQFTQNTIANWVIGQPAGAHAFSIWSGRNTSTDGNERLRIDSTGSVTINTPSSGTSLTLNSVVSSYALLTTDGSQTSFWYSGGNNTGVGTQSAHSFNLYAGNSSRLTISSSGNVTINAPASGTALVTTAQTTNSAQQWTSSGNATNGSVTLSFDSAGSATLASNVAGGASLNIRSLGTGSNIYFGTTGNTTAMLIQTGGGVTLSAPTSGVTLQMTGTAAGSAALKLNTTATTGAQTATWTAPTNKPGAASGTVAKWLPIDLDGTTYYIPCWT